MHDVLLAISEATVAVALSSCLSFCDNNYDFMTASGLNATWTVFMLFLLFETAGKSWCVSC